MIVDEQRLETEIAAGLAVLRDKCPNATLKLVQDGVAASPFTRPKFLRICRAMAAIAVAVVAAPLAAPRRKTARRG